MIPVVLPHGYRGRADTSGHRGCLYASLLLLFNHPPALLRNCGVASRQRIVQKRCIIVTPSSISARISNEAEMVRLVHLSFSREGQRGKGMQRGVY